MRKTKFSDASWKRSGGKRGSGLTHVQYGHARRPTLLHLKCSRCGMRATSKKPSEETFGTSSGDCSGTWNIDDWVVVCTECAHHENELSYAALPPLFYEEDGFFAWNRDHLGFLEKRLSEENTDDDPYRWYATYVKGEWLESRKQSLRTILKLKAKG